MMELCSGAQFVKCFRLTIERIRLTDGVPFLPANDLSLTEEKEMKVP